MRRWSTLLHDFGSKLGFECAWANAIEDKVVWKKDARVVCSFQVTDKEILVKASPIPNGENFAAGTISFPALEDALKAYKLSDVAGPANTPTAPDHLLLKVLENTELCPEHYLITLQMPKDFRELKPGQFFHVVCDPDGKKTLINGKERGYALTLRRPFSVHKIHYSDLDRNLLTTPGILPYEIRDIVQRPISKIDILYKIVGKGTRNLSQVRPGKLLDVIGPIGNGFSIERGRTGVIVGGGGIGIAPLVALAERLRYLGTETYMYLGAVEQMHLRSILRGSAVERECIDGTEFCELIVEQFEKIGAEIVEVCTDDGSVGEKGRVTDILEAHLEAGVIPNGDTTIYTCGPPKMLEKISDLAHKYKMPCQVLMEGRMACGIGACFSCTCSVRGKDEQVEKKRVCVDGPVFDAKEIIWQD